MVRSCLFTGELRVKLVLFCLRLPGRSFHKSLLKLSICSFLPFENWFCLTCFCQGSGVGDLASGACFRYELVKVGGTDYGRPVIRRTRADVAKTRFRLRRIKLVS
jgi:hypothetical protein